MMPGQHCSASRRESMVWSCLYPTPSMCLFSFITHLPPCSFSLMKSHQKQREETHIQPVHLSFYSLFLLWFLSGLFVLVWFLFYYLTSVSVSACICVLHHLYVWSPRSEKKERSDPPRLQLQKVMRHHVGTGSWTHVPSKSTKCS